MNQEELDLLKTLFGYEPKPSGYKRKIKPFREWNGQTENAGGIEIWDGKYEGKQTDSIHYTLLFHKDIERWTRH